ncbi:hypothetical protein T261_3704 [Streptomyces lydicus]|nr:hypothetical protein T261_3704 [Streptomyces lydicus]
MRHNALGRAGRAYGVLLARKRTAFGRYPSIVTRRLRRQ